MKKQTNIKKRIIASLLDYIIFCTLLLLIFWFFGKNEDGIQTLGGISLFTLPIIWLFYFVVIEYWYQASIGHLAMNLKVTQLDQNKISLTQALKRHLVDPIDVWLLGIPAILSIVNSDSNQRLGDKWAGTIVSENKDH